MGQSAYNTPERDSLLDQTKVTLDAGVMGENTSTAVALDGAGTWVPIINFSLSADSGNVTADGTAGTITVGGTDPNPIYQINMYCGIEESGAQKDWEFLLGWTVNGVTEQIGSDYITTTKSSTADAGVIITRALAVGDVVSLQMASLLKAVSVDIKNSTLELLRKF